MDADMSLLVSWETLGNALHVRNNLMAYAYRERDNLRQRINLDKRTVYKSLRCLKLIQQRLTILFSKLFDETEDNECSIAYRKGVNVHEVIAKEAGSTVMIKCDVRKYYDNISHKLITETLKDYGFTQRGANLVAHYCVVKNDFGFSSLQQGAPCSPALANLVGNKFLDRPILQWLRENCPQKFSYYRYSDNLVLFLKEDVDKEFVERYKKAVREIADKAMFRLHSWSTIRNNNPRRSQEFLGTVLNVVANMPRRKRDSLRATLFSAILDFDSASKRYLELNDDFVTKDENPINELVNELKFLSKIQGQVNYLRQVNRKYGNRIHKLFSACKWMRENGINLTPGLLEKIKKYNNDESEEVYMERVMS